MTTFTCELTNEEIQDILNGDIIVFDTEDGFKIYVTKEGN